jgi:aspartyl/asparaginyl-tRNA synthetase
MFDLKFIKEYLAFFSAIVNYDKIWEFQPRFHKEQNSEKVHVKELVDFPMEYDVMKRDMELLKYFNMLDKYIHINEFAKKLKGGLISLS